MNAAGRFVKGEHRTGESGSRTNDFGRRVEKYKERFALIINLIYISRAFLMKTF